MLIAIAPTSTVEASHTQGCPEVILEIFGPTSHVACQKAWCESSWNPRAYNASSGAVGLFQIMQLHGWGASFNPWINTQFAYQLSRGGTDWSQWSC